VPAAVKAKPKCGEERHGLATTATWNAK